MPTATVSCTWAITGAPTAHEALDDPVGSPDDATTRVTETTQGEDCRVNIASLTDPEVSTGHIIHFRATASGGGQTEQIIVRLFEGATQRATSAAITITRTTWNDYSYTLTAGEADSITNYADLRIELDASRISGGENVEATQTYFEVPDTGNPPISVSDVFNFVESYARAVRVTDVFPFVETAQIVSPYVPAGTYIWFIIAPPQNTTLGGVFNFTCTATQIVTGINSTGYVVCMPLFAPTSTTRGGVFQETCPATQFVRGIDANGNLICATP